MLNSMRTTRFTLLSSCFMGLLLVAACGRHSSKSDSPGPGPENPPVDPKNPALSLTDGDRASFEKWQASLTKSCSATEAFERESDSGSKEAVGIDLSLLLDKLKNSARLEDGAGTTAILGIPRSQFGEYVSELEEEASATGQPNYKLKAKFVRNGSICQVYLFDRLAHTTNIVSELPIAAFIAPTTPTIDPVKVYVRQSVSQSGATATSNGLGGITTLLATALRPNEAARTFVGNRLGIAKALQAKVISFGSPDDILHDYGSNYRVEGQLIGSHDIPVATGSTDSLIGSTTQLTNLWNSDQIKTDVTLTSRETSLISTSKTKHGLWPLSAVFKLKTITNSADEREVTLTELRLGKAEPFNDTAALECFAQRLDLYKDFVGADSLAGLNQQKFPEASMVTQPCLLFSEDFATAVSDNRLGIDTFRSVFKDIRGEQGLVYHGWDGLLKDVVLKIFAAKREPQAVLNSDNSMPLVAESSTLGSRNAKAAATHKNLAPIKDLPYVMAINWALYGEHPDDAFIARIFAAASNTINPFELSTMSMLGNLGYKPLADDTSLIFAEKVNAAYRNAAVAALKKAEALGDKTVISDRLGEVLQEQTSQATFVGWSATLDAAAEFKKRETERLDSLEGAGDLTAANQAIAFRSVVSAAIKEGWTKSSFVTLEKITSFSATKNTCDIYKTASTLATKCESLDKLSAQPGKLLAANFAGRYGDLAVDFIGHVKALGSESLSLRLDLERKFFDPIWGRCAKPAFDQRAKTLKTQISKLATVEALERFELLRAIDDTLEDCE